MVRSYSGQGDLLNKLFSNSCVVIPHDRHNGRVESDNMSIIVKPVAGTTRQRGSLPGRSYVGDVNISDKAMTVFNVETDIFDDINSEFSLKAAIYLTPRESDSSRTKLNVNVGFLVHSRTLDKYYVIDNKSARLDANYPDFDSSISSYFRSDIRSGYYAILNSHSNSIFQAAIKIAEEIDVNVLQTSRDDARYEAKAKNHAISLPDVAAIKIEHIEVPHDLSIQDKYVFILTQVNETQSNINKNTLLIGSNDLFEQFDKIETKLKSIAENVSGNDLRKEVVSVIQEGETIKAKPKKKSSWLGGLFGGGSNAADGFNDLADVDFQKAINIFFGKMYEEHEKILGICEQLRQSTSALEAQRAALMELEKEMVQSINSKYNIDLDALSDQDRYQFVPVAELTLRVSIIKQVAKLSHSIDKARVGVSTVSYNALLMGTELPEIQANLSTDTSQNILFKALTGYQSITNKLRTLSTEINIASSNNAEGAVVDLMDQAIAATKSVGALEHADKTSNKLLEVVATKNNELKEAITSTDNYLATRQTDNLLTSTKDNAGTYLLNEGRVNTVIDVEDVEDLAEEVEVTVEAEAVEKNSGL